MGCLRGDGGSGTYRVAVSSERGAGMSADFPEVRYADAGGVHIAYEVRGRASIDVVRVPGLLTSLVASALDPVIAAHYDDLARFCRLIRLDRRGMGLSDPLVSGGAPPLEQQAEDIVAVMDQVGLRRAALYGGVDGGAVALLFSAMYPERVSALVLNCVAARFFVDDGYPWGSPIESREDMRDDMVAHWGDIDDPWGFAVVAPSRVDERGYRKLLACVQQVGATKAAALANADASFSTDVRAVLPLVQVPALVLFPDESELYRAHGQYLVEHLPDAQIATYPGADTYFGSNTSEMGALIEEFLTGARSVALTDRVLATVLFTDIVSSTEHAVDLGDERWKLLLDAHDSLVRAELARAGGREVKHTGDGFLATFDGPARAIRCAQAISQRAEATGIAVRAGVHVGECEVRGADIAGIAVHIGARVCALAQPGEVLATSTVRDLVAGSGVQFTDRGTHTLKGVPGNWTILAAET